jgi:hypothetical protein
MSGIVSCDAMVLIDIRIYMLVETALYVPGKLGSSRSSGLRVSGGVELGWGGVCKGSFPQAPWHPLQLTTSVPNQVG